MSESSFLEKFKAQTSLIKIIVASLYLQYVLVLVLAILMITTGSMSLLCLLLPYVLAHWVAEGVLMNSRFWYIFGAIYFFIATSISLIFVLGLGLTVETSNQLYVISMPKTQITLLVTFLIIVYSLWAGITLLLQTPSKEK